MKNGYKIVMLPISKKTPIEALIGNLRDPQREIIPLIQNSIKKGKSVLLSGAPGLGKTKISMITANWVSQLKFGKSQRFTIIVTPTLGINENFLSEVTCIYDKKHKVDRNNFIEVHDNEYGKIENLVEAIKSYGGDTENIRICSYMTLVRVYERIKDLGLLHKLFVILDEGHHAGIEDNKIGMFLKDLDAQGGARYLMTTATPYRSNSGPVIPNDKNCDKHIFSYFKLLHQYNTPFVANQSISMICYDYVRPDHINKIANEETNENRYCTNLDKLINEYVAQYKSNPKQTLIIAPSKFIRGDMGLAQVCIYIEEHIKKVLPHVRICNVGGTYDGDNIELSSSIPKEAKKKYSMLKNHPNNFDIVISINVMNEGIDWNVCRQTFICGLTRNFRLFIQRDIGRGARMKLNDNNHSLIYFVAGIDNNGKTSKEFEKAMLNIRKNFVHFNSLLVLNESYVDFIKEYKVKMPKLFTQPEKIKEIPQEVKDEFIKLLQDQKDTKEDWSAQDTLDFIKECGLLEAYTQASKIDLFSNLEKEDAIDILQAVKKSNLKFKNIGGGNKRFELWYKIFVKEIGEIKFKSNLTNAHRYDMMLTNKLNMEEIKKVFSDNIFRGGRVITANEIEKVVKLIESV